MSAQPITFARRLEDSARLLFEDDSPLRKRLFHITGNLRADLDRMESSGTAEAPAIALVGRVGEGKSWLARTFLNQEALNSELGQVLLSGQNADARTSELRWIGPRAPFAAKNHGETWHRLEKDRMLDLGLEYVIGDSPGYSDHDSSYGALSSVAISSATVKIIATSISQLRDGTVQDFVAEMNGSVLLPVVRFRPKDDSLEPTEEMKNDTASEIEKWSAQSPLSEILPPIFVPDAGIAGEENARRVTRQRLAQALRPVLADREKLLTFHEVRTSERLAFAKKEAAAALQEFRSRLGPAVDRVAALTNGLPEVVENELIGEQPALEAAVRTRLRADVMERTPLLAFPFRSFLGLLSLTVGAWDRLIFASFGSVPSLVMVAAQSGKNLREKQSLNPEEPLQFRIQALLKDAFRTDLLNFRRGLQSEAGELGNDPDPSETMIEVSGLAGLETESREVISNGIRQHRLGRFFLGFTALLATVIFWGFLGGPLSELYSHYWSRLVETYQGPSGNWAAYPAPNFGILLSSFWLSLFPSILLAFITMAVTCRRGRVKKAATRIRKSLQETIHSRLADESLRLEILDPKVEAARFLTTL